MTDLARQQSYAKLLEGQQIREAQVFRYHGQ
jgi:hypothetical protein